MNEGFFYSENIKKETPRKKSNNIRKETDNCSKCGLEKQSFLDYSGDGGKEILLIFDYPREEIESTDCRLSDDYLNHLYKIAKENNIKIKFDCWITYALKCSSEKEPSIAQVNYCRNNILKVVDLLKPKKIICFGKVALQSIIGHKISVTDIDEWIGWEIPDQDYNCFIFPTYDLQSVIEKEKNIPYQKKFEDSLNYAFNFDRKFKDYKDISILIQNENEAIDSLKNILALKEEIIAFDIETTGLKPYDEGHKIVSFAITQSNLKTFSFLLTDKIKPFIIEILQSEKIKKIAHNLQFENRWCQYLFGIEVKGWYFDTQLSTHILDNRSGITGLKFQTYVNFGVIEYEKNIKKYISSDDSGFNKMLECPVDELLLYNGYDSYFTMLLYQKHIKLLDSHLKKGFNLFLNGNIELSQLNGMYFDIDVYNTNYNELTKEIDKLHNEIMISPEIEKVENKQEFNYNSDKQLRELIYDKCKWKPIKSTSKGSLSVDETTLIKLNKDFTNKILQRKKITKIRDTYLDQFYREAVKIQNDYYLFPNFNLNTARTYRSSSSNPNFQNIPVRDEKAKLLTRGCLKPRKNRQLLEIDFKGMEVSTSACYHQDPMMVSYVTNPINDMHRDVCLQLFKKDLKTFTKYDRYCAKNGFVFRSFYGSTARIYRDEDKKKGYGEITKNLWEMMSDDTKEHLSNNGIKTIQQYQKHIECIEVDFWENRFPVYKEWKMQNWKDYKQNGFVELKTGFRCNSLMSFNDVNNYPIQGSAFHILLWCLIEVNRFLKKRKMESFLIGQIHDSMVFDVAPYELDYLVQKIKQIATVRVREYWDWIIVPLMIEAEITEINQSWNTKKELKI